MLSINEQHAVGGCLVERIGEHEFAVRLPDSEWCVVSEDADGQLQGHPAAVEAVNLAMMACDYANGECLL